MVKEKIFILITEILFAAKFNIGGEISIGEIIILIFFITHFKQITNLILIRKYILKLYLLLFTFQLISEFFTSNGLNDSLRGLMITLFSFFHLSFLIYYAQKDISNIIYAFLGYGFAIFFLSNTADIETAKIISGEDASFVKMKLTNIVGMALVFISFYINKRRLMFFLFLFWGGLIIILGGRSGGMTIIVAGIIGYFFNLKKIQLKNIYIPIISIIIISYLLYTIYVYNVLNGNIISGNNHQILELKNPYNPFELIVQGRGEFFVGIQAFLDKFLFGHGAWAKDTTGKYWIMLARLKGENSSFIGTWLPVHSVLIGWGVYNGIFTLLAGIKLFVFFLKTSYKTLIITSFKNPLKYCLSYSIIAFLWNILFSPPSHFRLSLPIYMAGILTTYFYSQKKLYQLKKRNHI